jgi:hypothetical protein
MPIYIRYIKRINVHKVFIEENVLLKKEFYLLSFFVLG